MNENILVVTGLPRSGTSLVMQMLQAGGIEPMTDGERVADIDNPRGYLEFEAVKQMKGGAPWIADARGKAVKVISHLLADLPACESYRVVFIERDLDEVMASQAKMITRLGRLAPPQDAVRQAFLAHLRSFDQWAAENEVLRLAYADVIADPTSAVELLAEFAEQTLEVPLDKAAMAAAVDASLYRNRSHG